MSKKKPNPIDVHIGSRLRMRRLMLDMSQTSLAEVLGLTFQQVQKYEKGTNRISGSRLQETADALRVPVTFFFDGQPGGNGTVESPPLVADFLSTRDGIAIAQALAKLSPKTTRRVRELVEAIAGGDQ